MPEQGGAPKTHKHFFLITGGVVLLAVVFAYLWVQIAYTESVVTETENIAEELREYDATPYEKTQAWQRTALEDPVGVIIAVGDIMLDRGVRGRVMHAEKGGGDWSYPFRDIAPLIQSADIAFANMESVISDRGTDSGKKYSFRVPPAVVPAVANAGFDVLSIANNHTFDYGSQALCDTATLLEAGGITPVGAGCTVEKAEQSFESEIANTKVAFLGYTEFYKGATATPDRPGFAFFQTQHILDRTRELHGGGTDVVIVSLHWGTEYKPRSNSVQQDLGRALIDGGVDIVLGHHPHVDQEIERYGDGWIVYSLGNFVFDQSWSEDTMEGMLAKILVSNGRVLDIEPYLFAINKNFQPQIPEGLVVDEEE